MSATTVWPPARQALAALTVGVGAATTVAILVLGATGWTTVAGLAYAVTVPWALTDRRAVSTEVVVGVLAAAAFVVEASGTVVATVPVITGVVATAELTAATGRLGMVVRRDPRPELVRVVVASGVAVVAAGLTVGAGALPGPDALVATVVGATGLALTAGAVALDRRRERGDTVAR